MRNKILPLVALAAVTAIAAGPAAQGSPQATRTVAVGNDFFSPRKLTVGAGTTVRWRWRRGADAHNIKLRRGPRGVRRFSSKTRDAPFSFRRRLSRRGTYSMICTLHSGMTQRITVK